MPESMEERWSYLHTHMLGWLGDRRLSEHDVVVYIANKVACHPVWLDQFAEDWLRDAERENLLMRLGGDVLATPKGLEYPRHPYLKALAKTKWAPSAARVIWGGLSAFGIIALVKPGIVDLVHNHGFEPLMALPLVLAGAFALAWPLPTIRLIRSDYVVLKTANKYCAINGLTW